ncbi:hypothetical protein EYZ11_009392 [Aspergillus tanneri]|uniref:Uncharacterized protein n=1 Tax=Aspergillus tanneri TaxID=1220188 RepID=A0A4S3J8F5_9EURO|nr:hypothetical protein EYZ11_009392 [Aspergillus tanneri]
MESRDIQVEVGSSASSEADMQHETEPLSVEMEPFAIRETPIERKELISKAAQQCEVEAGQVEGI